MAGLSDRVADPELGFWLFESAYFEARHRNHAAKARAYLDRAPGRLRADDYAIPRCEAAVLLAEGRFGDAEQALAEAKRPSCVTGRLEIRWWNATWCEIWNSSSIIAAWRNRTTNLIGFSSLATY
jgi:hypothetical protein